MNGLLRGRFVGMHELRQRLPKLLDILSAEGQELVITRQGKPAAVIVDLERYLEVQEALKEFSDPAYLRSLLLAREEVRAGGGTDVEEVFRERGL